VLELTEAAPDETAVAEPPPRPPVPPPPRVEIPPPAAEEIEIVDAPEATNVPAEEPPPGPALAPDRGGLISEAAADASAASLASLASRMAQMHAGFPLGHGNRTIEDLVKEVMRPMIKEWLDAHLPSLVERLVRREIDRIARRVDDD
jgi:cell pole-organizing protein PopZ